MVSLDIEVKKLIAKFEDMYLLEADGEFVVAKKQDDGDYNFIGDDFNFIGVGYFHDYLEDAIRLFELEKLKYD